MCRRLGTLAGEFHPGSGLDDLDKQVVILESRHRSGGVWQHFDRAGLQGLERLDRTSRGQ